MTTISPLQDSLITERYGAGNLEKKLKNKTALQEEFGWPAEPKRPMVCFPAGMTDQLGGKLLEEVLPGMLNLEVEILIVGKGSSSYGTLFTKLAKEQPHRVHIVPAEEKALHKMYAACDMAMFLSDAPTKELEFCLKYGVVPVSPAQEILEDYNPVQERGNAFVYTGKTMWHAFAALVRACETYKFPFDWRTIQKQCMEDK